MAKTLIILFLICLLAVIAMVDFIIVIPKFGTKYFGAPDDIKEMVSTAPDKPMWVNILGMCLLIAVFGSAAALLIWGAKDALKSGMSFFEVFLRFLIILDGYKLFDIIFFDYLMLTKWKLPLIIYPETAGAKAYDSFGFNKKSQIARLILFAVISLLIAYILTVVIH